MVVLKKIKASTLMETLVATVLIVVAFMIASAILNNLFFSTVKNTTRAIDAHLNELQYLYRNGKLNLPYHDDFKSWEISIERYKETGRDMVLFEAIDPEANKNISRQFIEN